MEKLLKSKEGKLITFLTRACYYDIPYPNNIKPVSKNCFCGMNALYFELEHCDLIIFRGTNSLRDWFSNIAMALFIKPMQFKSAIEFCEEHMREDKKLIICGHSLGGAISQYVLCNVNHSDKMAITYNTAGAKHLIKKTKRNNICYNYVTDKDILNRILRHMPFSYFKHIGEDLIIKDTESKNGFKSHSNFEVFINY